MALTKRIIRIMASIEEKLSQNVPGRYYVDKNCIACDACVIEAPQCFAMDDESGHAWVTRQPKTPQEEEDCQNALHTCPVEAIGNDGEP